MSGIASGWAWRQRGLTPTQKFVLMALADRHNKDDNEVWPSIPKIAYDTGFNDRTVMKTLGELAQAGLIIDSGKRTGRTKQVKVWRLALDRMPSDREPEPSTPEDAPEQAESAPPEQCTNAHPSGDQRVHVPAGKGASFSRKGCKNMHPEPLIEPLKEPNRADARATATAKSEGSEGGEIGNDLEGFEATQFRRGLVQLVGRDVYRNIFKPCSVQFDGSDFVLRVNGAYLLGYIPEHYGRALRMAARKVSREAGIRVEAKPKVRKAPPKRPEFGGMVKAVAAHREARLMAEARQAQPARALTQQARAGAARARNGLAMGAA